MTIDEIFEKSSFFDTKDLISIKKNGVVFTKRDICDTIIYEVKPNINDIICEPSVGKGIFIFSLLEYFKNNGINIKSIAQFVNNRLFCYDINIDFINEFKYLLNEYFLLNNYVDELELNNIIVADFLTQTQKYDLIIGNPPYVKIQNIDKDYLKYLKQNFKSLNFKNIDIFYAFIEKAMMYSKKVGFIVPNSFIKSNSGEIIRKLIKYRLKYLYDFGTKKNWNNISVYTAIIILDEFNSNEFIYKMNELSVIKNKEILEKDKWVLSYDNEDNFRFKNIINSSSIQISTLKDKAYIIDYIDGDFCYKNGYKIEIGVCKKYIKATKSKNFNNHGYIIYPYMNGNIINEFDLSKNYPFCYKYLLSIKDELLERDSGKSLFYPVWYSYGRKQGLLKEKIGIQILIPTLFKKSKSINYIIVPENEECLVISGISLDINEDRIDKFLEIINSKEFYNYCEFNNKTLPDANIDDLWLSINMKTIKYF